MDVVSACPLRVASLLWQPKPGAFALSVVCVASYTLEPGESPLATVQEEPNEADSYWNDDEGRSLHLAGDLVPFKPRAEVLLAGYAYAPGGEPVRAVGTRLIVGDIDKSISVNGDRVFTFAGELRGPSQFTRMSLRWERAAGGPDTSNPVGVRLDAPPDARGMVPLPNLQPPGSHLARRGDFVPPIGYGPIAPSWPSRAARLHRHAAGWDHRRFSQRPLPGDIDFAYFNAAPSDQQLDALRSNERLVLENLHPAHPRLVTSLAQAVPRAVIERAGQRAELVELRADTLCIDTERGRCTLAWRGTAALRHPQETGRVMVTIPSAGRSGAPRSARANSGTADLTGMTPASASLPFGGNSGTADLTGMTPASTSLPFVKGADAGPSSAGAGAGAAARSAPGSLGARPPPAPAHAAPVDEMSTYAGELPRSARTLPFVGATRAPSTAPATVSFEAPDTIPLAPAALPAPPARVPAVPPPLLSTPVVDAPAPAAAPPAPAAARAAPAPAPAPAPPPGPEPAPAEYVLSRCAAIAASLARRPLDVDAILTQEGLTSGAWEKLRQHWDGEIRRETARGKARLLRAYDAAYVARLEAERGPIEVTEYARLSLAAERGGEQAALADLRLPAGATPRIQRVWLRRIAEDAALASRVRGAEGAAREEEA